MTERRQFREVCAWNRQLSRENSKLRAELHRTRSENETLEAANAELGAQAQAAECLLGSAMSEARGVPR
jgi:hypothetical protein